MASVEYGMHDRPPRAKLCPMCRRWGGHADRCPAIEGEREAEALEAAVGAYFASCGSGTRYDRMQRAIAAYLAALDRPLPGPEGQPDDDSGGPA